MGPNISVRAAYATRESTATVLFGDREQLRGEALLAGFDESVFVEVDEGHPALPPGRVGLVDTGRVAREVIELHAPSSQAGEAQLTTLRRAAEFVRAGRGRALVTAPTSKEAIVRAGQPFTGQTEFLAQLDGRADDDVTMLFLGPTLRVALVTTHLALGEVPRAVTRLRVLRTVRHLAAAVLRLRLEGASAIAVVGLNPHAGEAGLFGREELETLGPALVELRGEPPFMHKELTLRGPLPAEGVFRAAQRGELAGVVAMYHDQATIAAKLLDWGASVNTTWGLSFVRTSVDHGVAYDAARTRSVEVDGMSAALAMAVRLTAVADG